MLDLTLLVANPPQSHINSFNQELLKYADELKAQQLQIHYILHVDM